MLAKTVPVASRIWAGSMQGRTDRVDGNAAAAGLEQLLIGISPAIVALRTMIARVAQSSAPVLICGPSGSGKEVVAQAIHRASARSAGPFAALNCGAIPGELIESELFGHERGAFTGAHQRRVGQFEAANGGSLFLDEIGDMRFDMQVRLLRVLEQRTISRIGGNDAIPVDVRIISATHQDLDRAITEQRFREDLFFRLGVIVLHMPDLASRRQDIPLLIAHFQQAHPASMQCRFSASAMERLMAHDWRGNVRELRNVVERSAVLFPGETICASEVERLLGNNIRMLDSSAHPPRPCEQQLPGGPIDLRAQVEHLELEQIRMALIRAEGIISEAARLLTLKRTTLIEKMRKYGVERIAA